LDRAGAAATVALPGPPREHYARHLRRRPRRGPRPRAPLRPGPASLSPPVTTMGPAWPGRAARVQLHSEPRVGARVVAGVGDAGARVGATV
jgi:hypothetical protein